MNMYTQNINPHKERGTGRDGQIALAIINGRGSSKQHLPLIGNLIGNMYTENINVPNCLGNWPHNKFYIRMSVLQLFQSGTYLGFHV